jgi:hypothetical protein
MSFIMFDQHMQRKARGSVLKAEDNPNILDELTTIGVKSLDKMKAPCRSIHGHFKGCDLDSMSIISDLTDVPASEFANLSAVDILARGVANAQQTSGPNNRATRASSMHNDSLTLQPAMRSLDRTLSNASIPQRRRSIRL